MTEPKEIINKVAQSGLIDFDLQKLRPSGSRRGIDIKEQLWQGLALKEKEFRAWIKEHDWSQYADAYVAVYCSTHAIIPSWAFMLIASKLLGISKATYAADLESMESQLYQDAIAQMDTTEFEGGRVIVKGCGDGVPQSAYLYLTVHLQSVVKSLMFGEACSAVPVYKAPRNQ